MRRIIPFIVSILFVGLIACEPEEIAFDPSADVFIITKTIQNGEDIDTIYGLALHVFANKPMTNVTATTHGGPELTYELDPYDGYTYDYYWQTSDADFSTLIPYIGTYDFDALAETGESETLSDNLLDDIIYPTDTLKAKYDVEKKELNLNWNKIKDADYIVIKMFDAGQDLMFAPDAIIGTATSYTFKTSTSGWVDGAVPTEDETYSIELDAYYYEPGQLGVNLQGKSINFKDVVWGD